MVSTPENQTSAVTFILVGFSEYPDLQVPLFLLFLTTYSVTVLGNMGMIAIIRLNAKFYTPCCVLQFFFACIFVVTETFMLAVMAYDRFVAVCNPLLYTVAMSPKLRCSLVFIVITVVKMPATGGRYKVFSTCASHRTAISIFHGTILFLYCVPTNKSSWLLVKVASVFYTVIVPMLNPLIHSFRNKDVKEAVKKLISSHLSLKI
ncbi:hypothetical protein U0070_003687 [Myodes glareolus]|uniref:G-protein coupled receptors family 1 profile domain-containing protein n=1 Tax=Myodes glareolus TaxID=447135 RepID=A0AAW0GVK8_MYOGA